MARGINASTISALQTDSFSMCHLVQLDFPTVIRITDWNRDISALSTTFQSSGHLLEIGQSAETSEPRTNSIDLSLSGVSQEYISIFLSSNYMDVRARIWIAVLGANDTVVGAPFLIFDGRIANFGIDDSEQDSVLSVEISSHWKDFELRKGRRTNRNSQQYYFSTDEGMDFAGAVVQDLKWGRE
jgi:hypothetical protein